MRPNIVLYGHVRQGRGFSTQEIEKAGLNWMQAKLLQVPIDKRRETVHEENVKVLQYLKTEAHQTVVKKKEVAEKKVKEEKEKKLAEEKKPKKAPAMRGG